MQKYSVYSIYDCKAQTYGNLFIASTDGLALRLLRQLIEYGGNPDYTRYSEDFALYCLASYTDTDGHISPCQPRLISTFVSVVNEIRGAAVGGESPLKSQSVNNAESDTDAASSAPACDVEDSAISQLKETEND